MVLFQWNLSSLEQWTNEWRMEFSVEKSQMVLFEGKFVIDKAAAVVYTLDGVRLVVVDSFKYKQI